LTIDQREREEAQARIRSWQAELAAAALSPVVPATAGEKVALFRHPSGSGAHVIHEE
jgi:hypothetical protein